MREAKADGVKVLADVTRSALGRGVSGGRLFDDGERQELADALAGVNATADLLGRSRVRELADKADATAFRSFADAPAVRIMAPEAAVRYFRGLVPSLDYLDPERFGESMRRRAFTLAVDTEGIILGKVQEAIARAIEQGKSSGDAAADVDGLLDAAGVTDRQRGYADLVFRTNAHDSYTTAAYEEMRHPDVRNAFPAWEYLNPADSRSRPTHAAKHGRYYPAAASFAEVRGTAAGDVIQCRCNFRPVTADEWAELEAGGAKIEDRW